MGVHPLASNDHRQGTKTNLQERLGNKQESSRAKLQQTPEWGGVPGKVAGDLYRELIVCWFDGHGKSEQKSKLGFSEERGPYVQRATLLGRLQP